MTNDRSGPKDADGRLLTASQIALLEEFGTDKLSELAERLEAAQEDEPDPAIPDKCHNCGLLQLENDRLKREVRDLEDEIRDTAKGAHSEGVLDERERQEEWR